MNRFKVGTVLKDSWKNLKRKYFMNVLVVFAVAIIIGGYSLGTRTTPMNFRDNTSTGSEVARELVMQSVTGQSNAEALEDLVDNLSKKEVIPADITARTARTEHMAKS